MIKIISINYQERSEQAVARPQSAFKNMPDVIQLDCLNDAIYDLEQMRDELEKKINPVVKSILYGNQCFFDNGLTLEQQEQMDYVFDTLMSEVKIINPKFYQTLRAKELTEKDVMKLIHNQKNNIIQNDEGQYQLFGE